MISVSTLDIKGYQHQAVPNTFMRQDRETSHLAILFPGMGYAASMPVLYYPGRILVGQGADLLGLEYDYKRSSFQALSDEEQDRWFFADISAACDTGLAQRSYEQVTVLGKSIGTLAMGHLLTTEPRLQEARWIWLTPLLRNERLRDQIKQIKHRALFVIGSADGHYDLGLLAEVERATGGDSLVIGGANHSLEIEHDIMQTIHALERVLEAIKRFLTES
jgi:hypothetical protein